MDCGPWTVDFVLESIPPMSPPDPSTRGTIGPYRIVAKIGEGGMGEVFKAWDPRLERDVAIKLLHPDSASGNPDRQRRLLAEGRAASALNHPNILRVYDADVDGTSLLPRLRVARGQVAAR